MTQQSGAGDVVVIGGGIVGLATALALAVSSRLAVTVVEAESRVAAHQTGRNSGVIHSGLYYKPGSLKARLCAEGRESMYAFCAAHGIPHERCGKLVVATAASQLEALAQLEERGRANGLTGLRRLARKDIRTIEPNIEGVEALWVAETGIVDYRAVCEALAAKVREAGHAVRTDLRVRRVVREDAALHLQTSQGVLRARYLVNCAGLQSDRVARMCGMDPGLHIVPFRGEYYVLKQDRRDLVRGLVYPVPDPRYPFLGVHFTRRITGEIEAGPNAVLALKREGYTRGSASFSDLRDILGYRGFWALARRHWRMGIGEMYRSWSKAAFVRALRQLAPGIRAEDLEPGGAGVRAQAVTPDGALVDDFRIVEAERMVHVLNAPSPAATASLSIGRYVAQHALRHFGEGSPADPARPAERAPR